MDMWLLKSTFGDETELLGVFSLPEKASEAFRAVAWDAKEVCNKEALDKLSEELVRDGCCETYNTSYELEPVKLDELLVGLVGDNGNPYYHDEGGDNGHKKKGERPLP